MSEPTGWRLGRFRHELHLRRRSQAGTPAAPEAEIAQALDFKGWIE
jgi:hypothetical protein